LSINLKVNIELNVSAQTCFKLSRNICINVKDKHQTKFTKNIKSSKC